MKVGEKIMKNNITTQKFFSDKIDPYKFNNIPWPRINQEHIDELSIEELKREGFLDSPVSDKISVPLKKVYDFHAMDYLDGPEALPIFKHQADIIMNNNHKKILDIGSRHGPVNDILYKHNYIDENYFYLGFDTSSQPIEYASAVWENFPNIRYKIGDWDKNYINEFDFTNFDCLIFSGVLLYKPDNHKEFFNRYMNYYNAKSSIIQEPSLEQDNDKWIDKLYLNTIVDEIDTYSDNFTIVSKTNIQCNIFCGHRIIWHLTKK